MRRAEQAAVTDMLGATATLPKPVQGWRGESMRAED
jgi:hypothetical protein